jgi:putative transposase
LGQEARQVNRAQRRALSDRAHPTLSINRQCHLLGVSRATVYRRPRPVSADDLQLMALIDRQYLARPYDGSRRMAAWLATQGHPVNRNRVQRLMRLRGLVAIYPRPNTTKAAPEHPKYPYRLGGLTIDRVNQVWATDITYSAPRPRWAGMHMPGMHRRKEEKDMPALCCERA